MAQGRRLSKIRTGVDRSREGPGAFGPVRSCHCGRGRRTLAIAGSPSCPPAHPSVYIHERMSPETLMSLKTTLPILPSAAAVYVTPLYFLVLAHSTPFTAFVLVARRMSHTFMDVGTDVG